MGNSITLALVISGLTNTQSIGNRLIELAATESPTDTQTTITPATTTLSSTEQFIDIQSTDILSFDIDDINGDSNYTSNNMRYVIFDGREGTQSGLIPSGNIFAKSPEIKQIQYLDIGQYKIDFHDWASYDNAIYSVFANCYSNGETDGKYTHCGMSNYYQNRNWLRISSQRLDTSGYHDDNEYIIVVFEPDFGDKTTSVIFDGQECATNGGSDDFCVEKKITESNEYFDGVTRNEAGDYMVLFQDPFEEAMGEDGYFVITTSNIQTKDACQSGDQTNVYTDIQSPGKGKTLSARGIHIRTRSLADKRGSDAEYIAMIAGKPHNPDINLKYIVFDGVNCDNDICKIIVGQDGSDHTVTKQQNGIYTISWDGKEYTNKHYAVLCTSEGHYSEGEVCDISSSDRNTKTVEITTRQASDTKLHTSYYISVVAFEMSNTDYQN